MPCLADLPYDVVLFLLDDMRADQVAYLPETMARLAPQAVTFDRAYVTTPLCCPERASFLSGGWYAHQTGVMGNVLPTGGATLFPDSRTLPTRLQEAGYTTALIGKYLNDYEALGATVPPGWSHWAATVGEQPWTDYDVIVGSSTPEASATGSTVHRTRYMAEWQTTEALSVLEGSGDTPLFLYLSFLAPHDPHTPAREDRGEYEGFTYRDRAYEEADVSDKPSWLQALPLLTDEERERDDAVHRQRLQTLLAADRGMAEIVDTVRASDRADRTVFVLSSDNGMLWREHRLDTKGVGYEESVRVPLVIAHPDLSPSNTSALVAANLDLAATVQALAGLDIESEGVSLISALCDGADTGRDEVLLQAWVGESPMWSGLVTATEKYIETGGGEREFYDLTTDPYEEESQHENPAFDARMSELAERLAELRGLSLAFVELPDATVGQPYEVALEHWGGEAPVTWAVTGGALPAGLVLDARGMVSGVPEEAGEVRFRLGVEDSSVSPVHGGPQSASNAVSIVVNEASPEAEVEAKEEGCSCGGSRGGVGGFVVMLLVVFGRRR